MLYFLPNKVVRAIFIRTHRMKWLLYRMKNYARGKLRMNFFSKIFVAIRRGIRVLRRVQGFVPKTNALGRDVLMSDEKTI